VIAERDIMTTVQIIIVAVAAVACVIDLRERRIPNWLTFGAALAGVLFQIWSGGAAGLKFATLGWIAGVAVFFLPFALGGLGAGDVKLLGALGAWIGPMDILWLALYTGVAGMLLAVVVSLASGYLREALSNVWTLLTHWRVYGLRPLPVLTIHQGRGPKLAYGLAIFAGPMVTVWIG
jgi:prepilin peptidase CpaA